MPILFVPRHIKQELCRQTCASCAPPQEPQKTWTGSHKKPTSLEEIARNASEYDIPTKFDDVLDVIRAAGIEVSFEELPHSGPAMADTKAGRIVFNTGRSVMRKMLENPNFKNNALLCHMACHEADHLIHPPPSKCSAEELKLYEQAADRNGAQYLNHKQFKVVTEHARTALEGGPTHGTGEERAEVMEAGRKVDALDPRSRKGMDALLRQRLDETAAVQAKGGLSASATSVLKAVLRNWGSGSKSVTKEHPPGA